MTSRCRLSVTQWSDTDGKAGWLLSCLRLDIKISQASLQRKAPLFPQGAAVLVMGCLKKLKLPFCDDVRRDLLAQGG